jgi:hypothetical protein
MTWEYKTLSLPVSEQRQEMLSEMGLAGWELIGFEQGLAYFKRTKVESTTVKATEAAKVAATVVETRTLGSKKK